MCHLCDGAFLFRNFCLAIEETTENPASLNGLRTHGIRFLRMFVAIEVTTGTNLSKSCPILRFRCLFLGLGRMRRNSEKPI